MIETAIEVTDGKVPATVLKDVLAAGGDMLVHPVEPSRASSRRSPPSPATTP